MHAYGNDELPRTLYRLKRVSLRSTGSHKMAETRSAAKMRRTFPAKQQGLAYSFAVDVEFVLLLDQRTECSFFEDLLPSEQYKANEIESHYTGFRL